MHHAPILHYKITVGCFVKIKKNERTGMIKKKQDNSAIWQNCIQCLENLLQEIVLRITLLPRNRVDLII